MKFRKSNVQEENRDINDFKKTSGVNLLEFIYYFWLNHDNSRTTDFYVTFARIPERRSKQAKNVYPRCLLGNSLFLLAFNTSL